MHGVKDDVSPIIPSLAISDRRPLSVSAADDEAQVWRDCADQICAVGCARGEECLLYYPNVVSFHWQRSGGDVRACSESMSADAVEDLYLRTVLPLVLQTRGSQAVHASAVVTAQGVVAFCGPSTTGKSTLSVALKQHGYQLWADDAVALTVDQQDMVAVPLPFRTKLRSESSELLAETSDQYFRRHARAHKLYAVCILQRDNEPGSLPVAIRRLNAGEAFRELIAQAYWFVLPDVDSKRRMVEQYLEIAAKAEIYEVRFRPDLSRLPDLAEAIATQILGQAAPPLPVSRLHSVRAVDAR